MGSDRRDRPGLPGRSSFLASAFEGSGDGPQDTQTDCRICYGRSVGAYCSFRNEITGDCKPRPAMHRTLEFLLHHGYVVLLGWVFVEQVGLPLPSMPLLLAENPSEQHYVSMMERSEEHTSELQSPCNLVCRLLLEKQK